jgi:hypothetical protein
MLPLLIFLQQSAQSNEFLFKSEKVFTVMTVMLIIWGAVLVQLFLMERRVRRLERQGKG